MSSPDTALTGLIPISRVWSGTKVLAEDLAGEDLGDILNLHSDAQAWWVLDRTSDYSLAELQGLAKAFQLDQLVVPELTASDNRAKFEEIGLARLVLTNALTLDSATARVTVSPLSLLVTDRVIVCLADVSPEVDPRRWLAAAAERLARGGTEAALQAVMAGVVESHDAVIDWLAEAGDQLAEKLFTGRPLSADDQLWAFRLRNALTAARRVAEPLRTVLADLRAAHPEESGGAPVKLGSQVIWGKGTPRVDLVARRWKLLVEQQDRVADGADSLRDSLATVFETSLALADVQLNQVMKKLTGWAAIIAVPTLVTGFVGMNVRFPLDGTAGGFWLYLVLMTAAVIALYLAFKRRGWI